MSVIKQSRKQKLTLHDKHKEFFTKDPIDTTSNPLNLFDDLNRKDKVWLRITKQYLNKRQLGQ